MKTQTSKYKSQSARDAEADGYGGKNYWDYLERSAHELHRYYLNKGDTERAEQMLTRSLGEALQGNDGI